MSDQTEHHHILADVAFGGVMCVACGQRWSMKDLDRIIRELEAVKAREEAACLCCRERGRDCQPGCGCFDVKNLKDGEAVGRLGAAAGGGKIEMADPFTPWPPAEAELGWLAGVLEGEGSFMQFKRAPGVPIISLGMTDEDVVAHAAKLMGVSYHVGSILPSGKKRYQLMIKGRPRAGRIMGTLYSLMGERRQGQIDAALKF